MTIIFDEIIDEHVPSVQVETDWESGVNTVPSTTKSVLLLGVANSATNNNVMKTIGSVAAAKSYWGEGSRMAVMAEVFLKIAPRVPLYGISYVESVDASAPSQTIVFGSGPATSSGAITVWVGGRRVSVAVSIGDTVTNIGDDLEEAINGLSNAPFTANNSSGTVTITARNKGPVGNTIRLRAEQSGATAVTTTVTGATMTGGTLAGLPTTALSTVVANNRYHLIVLDTNDATQLGILKTHMELYDSPDEQKWGIGIGASVDTEANAATIADALGSYRMQLAWLEASETPAFEIAAAFAALRAKKDLRLSISGENLEHAQPAYSEASWPTHSELNQGLLDGLTPIQPFKDGHIEVVRSYICKNAADAPAVRDSRIIEISDYCDEYVIDQFTRKAKSKIYKTLSPAGTANTVTNKSLSKLLHVSLKVLDKLDYIQGVDTDWDDGKIVAEQNASNLNRADLAYPFRPTYTAEQIAIRKNYTTPEL